MSNNNKKHSVLSAVCEAILKFSKTEQKFTSKDVLKIINKMLGREVKGGCAYLHTAVKRNIGITRKDISKTAKPLYEYYAPKDIFNKYNTVSLSRELRNELNVASLEKRVDTDGKETGTQAFCTVVLSFLKEEQIFRTRDISAALKANNKYSHPSNISLYMGILYKTFQDHIIQDPVPVGMGYSYMGSAKQFINITVTDLVNAINNHQRCNNTTTLNERLTIYQKDGINKTVEQMDKLSLPGLNKAMSQKQMTLLVVLYLGKTFGVYDAPTVYTIINNSIDITITTNVISSHITNISRVLGFKSTDLPAKRGKALFYILSEEQKAYFKRLTPEGILTRFRCNKIRKRNRTVDLSVLNKHMCEDIIETITVKPEDDTQTKALKDEIKVLKQKLTMAYKTTGHINDQLKAANYSNSQYQHTLNKLTKLRKVQVSLKPIENDDISTEAHAVVENGKITINLTLEYEGKEITISRKEGY